MWETLQPFYANYQSLYALFKQWISTRKRRLTTHEKVVASSSSVIIIFTSEKFPRKYLRCSKKSATTMREITRKREGNAKPTSL